MVYPIVVYGDPVLRKRAKEVEQGSIDIKAFVKDMFDTMYAANGVGLAAPQIGKSIRVFVVDGTGFTDEKEDLSDFKKAFINPEILSEEGDKWEYEEGCLSIPNIHESISRPPRLTIRYEDEMGVVHEEKYAGMKARIIQHEYDHLDGKLFLDYLSPLRKRLLKGKLADISKGDVRTEYRILAPKR
jgi:peptide deformylase